MNPEVYSAFQNAGARSLKIHRFGWDSRMPFYGKNFEEMREADPVVDTTAPIASRSAVNH